MEAILIHNITRQEFEALLKGCTDVEKRVEYSVTELSELTGYSPAHLRIIIRSNNIPYRKTGKIIYVPHESLPLIPRKKKITNQ